MYHINEGQFAIPSSIEDKTIHILQTQLEGQPVSLTISRAQLDDENMATYVEQQIQQLKRQFKKYHLNQRQEIYITQPNNLASLPATILDCQYQYKNEAIFQRQCGIELADKKIVVITLTAKKAFNTLVDAYWQELINSFVARTPLSING